MLRGGLLPGAAAPRDARDEVPAAPDGGARGRRGPAQRPPPSRAAQPVGHPLVRRRGRAGALGHAPGGRRPLALLAGSQARHQARLQQPGPRAGGDGGARAAPAAPHGPSLGVEPASPAARVLPLPRGDVDGDHVGIKFAPTRRCGGDHPYLGLDARPARAQFPVAPAAPLERHDAARGGAAGRSPVRLRGPVRRPPGQPQLESGVRGGRGVGQGPSRSWDADADLRYKSGTPSAAEPASCRRAVR